MVESLWHDVRVGARSLRRTPGLTAAAILTLAVGLALNVVIFGIVKSVLLDPFPLTDPERLVVIWEQDLSRDEHLHEISYPNFRDWRARSGSFSELAAMGSTFWGSHYFIGADGEPYGGRVRAVSHSFFDALGASPMLGRAFVAEDDVTGAPPVMIVSHAFWLNRLGGDSSAVGRAMPVVEGEPVTLVGVMEPEFDYPPGTDLFIPVGQNLGGLFQSLGFTEAQERGLDVLFAVGRLKQDVSRERAQQELTGIVRGLREEHHGEADSVQSAHLVPLVEHLLGDTERALASMWAAVLHVMLLVCANLAGLFLVKQLARLREHAVRRALGATSFRVARQLLAEVGIVAGAGAVLGYVLAQASFDLVLQLAPEAVPRIQEARVSGDGAGLALAALVTLASVVLVTLGPALYLSRIGRKPGFESRTARRLDLGLGRALVVAQIALACILVFAGALVTRSFVALQKAELGFEPRGLLAFNLRLPDQSYATDVAKRAYYRRLLDEIESLPGVAAVGGVNPRPFLHGQVGNDWSFHVEGQTREAREHNPRASGMTVSTDYFRTMGIELLEGRPFTEADDDRATPALVVSESLARQLWPGESPIGKRLCCGQAGENGEATWLTVVGVVENTRSRDVYEPRLELYTHYLQGFSTLASFLVRTGEGISPLGSIESIRARVRAIDPLVAVDGVTTMNDVMDRVFAPWRFNMVAFDVFATVALGLAVLGLFALLAFVVRQSTRELGIRLALGATGRDVLRLVMGEATKMTAVGGGIGLAGCLALTRALESLLYETSALHPASYVAVTAILVAAALLASYVPAREAVRVDPSISLRHD